MKLRGFNFWGWLLLVPVVLGLIRLRFDAEVLDLLPMNVPAVEGLKLYQEHFSNARELIITISSTNRELTTTAAKAIAERLREQTNRVAEVIWRPPWLDHPEQTAELIAYLWLNQPPAEFSAVAKRLSETNLSAVLAAAREELATTLSPAEIARLSYDPFGLTRLPENIVNAAPGFSEGEELFAAPDGKFRILFVKSRSELKGYRECSAWLAALRQIAASALPSGVTIGFTGRPAFVAEISASIRHDMIVSVFGTAVIIAILFWLAHRRWKPMLWLLTLLALILGGTLALGGLAFGTINVVSIGFAAILLGLAVDYAVVHYQEALAHPGMSIPQVRRAIAPSIFWAAVTTVTAFSVLNFGGLPGLAQLGSLVAIGVTLSAFVMIFAFLPPLFPERMRAAAQGEEAGVPPSTPALPPRLPRRSLTKAGPRPRISLHHKLATPLTIGLTLASTAILLRGLPSVKAGSDPLRPRGSQAYAALDAIKTNLNQNREPFLVVISGGDESEAGWRLDLVESTLQKAVSQGTLSGFILPAALWPRPENQASNRATARELVSRRQSLRGAAFAAGFSEDSLGLTRGLLDTWARAGAATTTFWPTNPLCSWILEKFAARGPTNFFAAGFLFPATNFAGLGAFEALSASLPSQGVRLAGWELLGGALLRVVRQNLWKLVLPMGLLVVLALALAFRRPVEVLLSLGVLMLSGLCLLAGMRVLNWSWNLLNLMSAPLILGTGVDYSIFMQLALRRHQGDLELAHRSVGRALLLCGGTAVAGFGSLGLSSNAGMASLGQVCALGIAANMLLSIYVLPAWWLRLTKPKAEAAPEINQPSSLYSATFWSAGLFLARLLPLRISQTLAVAAARFYFPLAPRRREVVVQNLLPVLQGDRPAAEQMAQRLIRNFGLKLVDLWRYEAGMAVGCESSRWLGWDLFKSAHARGKGVIIITAHLGNWELGAELFIRRGIPLLVLTQAEPEARLTEMRRAPRARRGVETLVVGEDAFAFIEVIKRLQAGGVVALLADRPPPVKAVEVELFGRPFPASIAAAELARASGCAILTAAIVSDGNGYRAAILQEIAYERTSIADRPGRIKLTQEILRAFEPVIRQNLDQWYHFVPIWMPDKPQALPADH